MYREGVYYSEYFFMTSQYSVLRALITLFEASKCTLRSTNSFYKFKYSEYKLNYDLELSLYNIYIWYAYFGASHRYSVPKDTPFPKTDFGVPKTDFGVPETDFGYELL
jgi:hypothetical protein